MTKRNPHYQDLTGRGLDSLIERIHPILAAQLGFPPDQIRVRPSPIFMPTKQHVQFRILGHDSMKTGYLKPGSAIHVDGWFDERRAEFQSFEDSQAFRVLGDVNVWFPIQDEPVTGRDSPLAFLVRDDSPRARDGRAREAGGIVELEERRGHDVEERSRLLRGLDITRIDRSIDAGGDVERISEGDGEASGVVYKEEMRANEAWVFWSAGAKGAVHFGMRFNADDKPRPRRASVEFRLQVEVLV
jgi:hypothetical protein